MEEKDRKELLRKIKAKRGYLLNYHTVLSKHDPDLLNKIDELYSSQKYQKRNALDVKTKELMDIAVATCMKVYPGLEIHLKKAFEAGCTEEEIVEAIAHQLWSGGLSAVMWGFDVYARFMENGKKISIVESKESNDFSLTE